MTPRQVDGPAVRLGFALESGEPVDIPVRHLCVTGQTQEAGKTTTLEALIARSGLRALTFVTKRGEGAFQTARATRPYFREQADWRFVSSLLEAFLGERLKFERSWIMRASKGARTLADVRRNVTTLHEKARGLSADVYMVLGEYLAELVPAIAGVDWAARVELAAGVNVMDLTAMPASLQHLVIKSAIEWTLEHEHDTVVVVPEAWKFLPQGRGTPVKLAAAAYIRQGAALRNYLWLDSQDLGGIEKEILRSVPVWLLGVQRETNEIKRTLANIPASVAKPKASDIATLEIGQFIACWGKHAIATYVQPVWSSEGTARQVARGERAPSAPVRPRGGDMEPVVDVLTRFVDGGRRAQAAVNAVIRTHHAEEQEEFMSTTAEKKLDDLITLVTKFVNREEQAASSVPASHVSLHRPPPTSTAGVVGFDWPTEDERYQEFKRRLLAEAPEDPQILEVLVRQPEIRVKVERHTIAVDGDTLRGRLALLIREGFFDQAKEAGTAFAEVMRRGFKTAHPNVTRELGELARMGFVTRSNKWYTAVPAMKRNVVEA